MDQNCYLINVNSLMIPSLALATLKTLLKAASVGQVSCQDLSTEAFSEFRAFAKGVGDRDIVGFTVSSYNIKEVLAYSHLLRQVKPTVRIILGGPMVSSVRYSRTLMEKHPEVDFIVRGRADDTFVELVKRLRTCDVREIDAAEAITNLTYRVDGSPVASQDGKQHNPNFALLSPWLSEPGYLLADYTYQGKGWLPYGTGYGCPYRCLYCFESQQQFVLYSLERVKEELKLILACRPQAIFWYDSTFGYNRQRALDLMEYIASHNLGTRVVAYVNVHDIDEEFCRKARDANVVFGGVGLQTTSDKTCSIVRRQCQDLARLRANINSDLFQDSANARVGLIYGLPGEGYTDLKETLDFALSLRSNDSLGVYRYCYYPGTYLYEHQQGYVAKSDTDPEIVKSPDMSEEEVRRCNMLAAFYYIVSKCFPLTLASLAYMEGRSRSDVLEAFVDNVWPAVQPSMQIAAQDVAFANKEKESRESLQPLMDHIVRFPRGYCMALAEALLVHRTPTRRQIRHVAKWLSLDMKWRRRVDRRFCMLLQRYGRMETFVSALMSYDVSANKQGPLWILGRAVARSALFRSILLQAGVLWTQAERIPGLRRMRNTIGSSLLQYLHKKWQ